MFRKSVSRGFNAQQSIPIFPQAPVKCPDVNINVGHLFTRGAVVKPDLHPLEQDFGQTLDRENERYSRHQGVAASTFLTERSVPIDNWKRTDTKQIEANFFNSESYQEALKGTLGRFVPESRIREADFTNPFESLKKRPERKTLDRLLTETLVLIVKEKETGKWTVPLVQRKEHESLRSTADRLLDEIAEKLHMETFVPSNAPAGFFKGGSRGSSDDLKNFIFVTQLLVNNNDSAFLSAGIATKYPEYQWVSRGELQQDFKNDEFDGNDLRSVLADLTV